MEIRRCFTFIAAAATVAVAGCAFGPKDELASSERTNLTAPNPCAQDNQRFLDEVALPRLNKTSSQKDYTASDLAIGYTLQTHSGAIIRVLRGFHFNATGSMSSEPFVFGQCDPDTHRYTYLNYSNSGPATNGPVPPTRPYDIADSTGPVEIEPRCDCNPNDVRDSALTCLSEMLSDTLSRFNLPSATGTSPVGATETIDLMHGYAIGTTDRIARALTVITEIRKEGTCRFLVLSAGDLDTGGRCATPGRCKLD
jgi:hypothetical protein